MPLFLLIRHGENEFVKTGRLAGHLPDIHLNEHGTKQAQELATALANLPIKAIYTSPLERARETAAPIAEKLGLEAIHSVGLLETNIGVWAGQELKILTELPEWKMVQHSPSRFRFPQGETFLECQTRLVNVVEAIAGNHNAEDIIALVFHADPIKLVLAHYLGMPLDNFQRLGCDTASVSALFISEDKAIMLKHNQKPPFNLSMPQKNTEKP